MGGLGLGVEGGLGLDLGQDLGSGEAQGSFEAKRRPTACNVNGYIHGRFPPTDRDVTGVVLTTRPV